MVVLHGLLTCVSDEVTASLFRVEEKAGQITSGKKTSACWLDV
jgi:hypothetical protein